MAVSLGVTASNELSLFNSDSHSKVLERNESAYKINVHPTNAVTQERALNPFYELEATGRISACMGAKFCRMCFIAARGPRYEQGAAGALSAVLSFGPSVGTGGVCWDWTSGL